MDKAIHSDKTILFGMNEIRSAKKRIKSNLLFPVHHLRGGLERLDLVGGAVRCHVLPVGTVGQEALAAALTLSHAARPGDTGETPFKNPLVQAI